jgi:hypothetical protein
MPQAQGYYVAAPPGPPMYPAPPVYQQQQTSSAIPWWVWMGAGVLAAKAIDLVSLQLLNQVTAQLVRITCISCDVV